MRGSRRCSTPAADPNSTEYGSSDTDPSDRTRAEGLCEESPGRARSWSDHRRRVMPGGGLLGTGSWHHFATRSSESPPPQIRRATAAAGRQHQIEASPDCERPPSAHASFQDTQADPGEDFGDSHRYGWRHHRRATRPDARALARRVLVFARSAPAGHPRGRRRRRGPRPRHSDPRASPGSTCRWPHRA
jgi:hypothetical protein